VLLTVLGALQVLSAAAWGYDWWSSYSETYKTCGRLMLGCSVVVAAGLFCLWKGKRGLFAVAQATAFGLTMSISFVGRGASSAFTFFGGLALAQLAVCFWVTRKVDAPQPSRLSMWVFRLVVLAVVVGVCVAARISPEMLEPPLLEERIS
jgi:hypothetical protein